MVTHGLPQPSKYSSKFWRQRFRNTASTDLLQEAKFARFTLVGAAFPLNFSIIALLRWNSEHRLGGDFPAPHHYIGSGIVDEFDPGPDYLRVGYTVPVRVGCVFAQHHTLNLEPVRRTKRPK